MADNITLDSMSGGSVVAADDISSVFFQRIKLVHGADGVNAGDVSTANGLPVSLIAGAASIGILGANSGVDIGDVTINNASGGSAVNIQDGGNTITVDGVELAIMGGWDNAASDGVSVSGDVAHDAVDAGEPVKIGGKARTTPGNAVASLDRVDAYYDTFGRLGTFGPQTPDGAYISVSGGVNLEVKRQPINVGTNGQILISGLANRKLRVLNGYLLSSAAVTANIKSANNSDASGPMNLAANQGFIIPYAPTGNFESLASQALTISLSGAATVGGFLAYVEV